MRDHSVSVPLQAALASGLPVAVGLYLYESFESQAVAENGAFGSLTLLSVPLSSKPPHYLSPRPLSNAGIVPMPDTAKEKSLGSHAVLLVGYDEKRGVWIGRNSWGG